MGRRLLFLAATFLATVALMALQKPVFLLYYRELAASVSPAEWWGVVWHGLKLDTTVAGYVTALPVVAALVSLWLPGGWWRRILRWYFFAVAVAAAAIFAVDLGLYEYWGFRLDGTILIYLSDPREAMASVETAQALRQLLFFAGYAALMIFAWLRCVRLFPVCGAPAGAGRRIGASALLLVVGGLVFLAIRGGLSVATANVSKVYFSSNMFLNHAATNPLFSFLSTVGERQRYADEYPFFGEARRAELFDGIRGNARPEEAPADTLLRTQRPNVVLIVLESFGRTFMDERIGGEAVMPNMLRFKQEGVWFENMFANSFRTDRGEVAILNGFPAQTRMSIMKLPAKAQSLPSIARSLGREGYRTSFTYGGDLNFTDQASYMYGTGWQQLTWQKDLRFDAPTSKWGYADDVVTDYFAGEVLAAGERGEPFLAGLLTLSSHEPFDVPFSKFDDKVLNAIAFTDDCIGRMIDRWRRSPVWDNLLVVLVADHAYAYPYGLAYNRPLRHRIPMIWLGGAVRGPRTVERYASQTDLCATLLAQMGIDHAEFDYSRDLFSPGEEFAYYTFNDGFGVVTPDGATVYDCTSQRTVTEVEDRGDAAADARRLEIGKTLLQTTYVDIDRR